MKVIFILIWEPKQNVITLKRYLEFETIKYTKIFTTYIQIQPQSNNIRINLIVDHLKMSNKIKTQDMGGHLKIRI